eukprot:9217931-Ditylum_brightwellii.AAC.1
MLLVCKTGAQDVSFDSPGYMTNGITITWEKVSCASGPRKQQKFLEKAMMVTPAPPACCGWVNTTVAEGYIAESQQMKNLQMETLAGPVEKKQKTYINEGDGKVAVAMLKTGDVEVALENFADTKVVTPVSAAGSPGTAD